MIETIYLSGPITGIVDENKKLFREAQEYYEKLGYLVINPHSLGDDIEQLHKNYRKPKPVYFDYLAYDIHVMLLLASIVVLLPGWEKSYGCCQELNIAIGKKLRIWKYTEDKDLSFDISGFSVEFKRPFIIDKGQRFYERIYKKIYNCIIKI